MKKSLADPIKPYLATFLYFLILAFYSNFIFMMGNYKTFFYNCLVVALVCFLLNYKLLLSVIRTKEVACFVVLSITPLILGLLPSEYIASTKRYLQNIVYFILLCIIILFCIKSLTPKWRRWAPTIIATLCLGGMAFHLYGVLEVSSLRGFFSNPHYLALFCLMSLPVISYVFLEHVTNSKKMICAVSVCVIFFLLINTSSRPAWVALLVSYGAGFGFFLRGWQRAGGLILMTLLAVLSYLLLPDFIAGRVDEFVINFAKEERFEIWRGAVNMQLASDTKSWLFGAGPGSYKAYFEEYNTYSSFFYFPHNFFVEILFESGIVGLLIILFLYFKIYSLLFFVLNNDRSKRFLVFTLFVCLTSHLMFTFFTVPFYSKYVTLIQAPIVALALYYYDETRKRIIS